jgi:antitoxin (DNA-binding transcriptional repressor) of toxin-antitoxin stability system
MKTCQIVLSLLFLRPNLLTFSSNPAILETGKEGGTMSITATELKANLGKYLILAATEDVFITQYGKIVAKLTNPFQDRVEIAESLFGILPQTMTLEEVKEARLGEV